jgi:hypothetical protein
MDSILDGSLADDIADALTSAGIPFAVTITRDVPQDSPDPADPLPPITTNYPCSGWVDAYTAADLANSLILASDTKIIVVATTLTMPSPPVPGDRVTTQGKSYTVINVSSDPALATFELQARA